MRSCGTSWRRSRVGMSPTSDSMGPVPLRKPKDENGGYIGLSLFLFFFFTTNPLGKIETCLASPFASVSQVEKCIVHDSGGSTVCRYVCIDR